MTGDIIPALEPDNYGDDGQRSPRQQRRRANGEGTIGRRKDGRYEAKVFVRRSDGLCPAQRLWKNPNRVPCGHAQASGPR